LRTGIAHAAAGAGAGHHLAAAHLPFHGVRHGLAGSAHTARHGHPFPLHSLPHMPYGGRVAMRPRR
jgi:hypothetical protein